MSPSGKRVERTGPEGRTKTQAQWAGSSRAERYAGRGVALESFPFGMPVEPLIQRDRGRKRVFVLGVYASAVHARWVGDDGRTMVTALAVASEPEIFWRGEGAADIISGIQIPAGAGRLFPAGARLNGPSGRALDDLFLSPLGVDRTDSWLCDLLPLSRQNERQAAALARSYEPNMLEMGLPAYDWPPVPAELASEERRTAIEREVDEAAPEVIMTLGDQPLKWFTSHFGSRARLGGYGESPEDYGRLHPVQIADREAHLLPLVHPRQAGGLGNHSSKWANLHTHWVENVASSLLGAPAQQALQPDAQKVSIRLDSHGARVMRKTRWADSRGRGE